MTLRNAFGELALDETLAALKETVETLHEYLLHRDEMMPPRALQYARTPTDQMRVSIDAGVLDRVAALDIFNNGAYSAWYQRGAPNSMDLREQQRELTMQTFNSVRNNRWVIT